MPKVSVIIAAYNAGKYISRCLRSILEQSFPDFEIILVNDGSTDDTAGIAAAFAAEDPRISIINQSNAGVAHARQVGLDASAGEFVIHVDSDDWAERDMLRDLVRCAEEESADMVICDYYEITGNDEVYRPQMPSGPSRESILGDLFFNLHGSLWNKLIRLSTINKYEIRFIPGMNICEDQFFCLRLASHGIKVSYLNRAYYHYDTRQNENSLINRGIPAKTRLAPLEMITGYTDLSSVQDKYDTAICLLAYQYLLLNRSLCPDYREVFLKHKRSICRASGIPLRNKLLILLRLCGIHIPVSNIKRYLHII